MKKIIFLLLLGFSILLVAKDGWNEKTSFDSFTNKKSTYAVIQSDNKQNVGALNKPVSVDLVVWKNNPKEENFSNGSLNIMGYAMPLALNRNLYCVEDYGCKLEAKFDNDDKIFEFETFELSKTNNTISLALSQSLNYGSIDFFDKALYSNKIQIRLNFYQKGKGTFSFTNSTKFNWSK